MTGDQHRVLVVDDDPALREIYASALAEFGYEARSAADGSAALRLLSDGFLPCVIFFDLRMPGMDGWEMVRRMRADDRWREIPLVVVAAHFRIDHEARDLGAAAWLQKPFDLSQLDQTAQALCG